jgi:hypothetical protein
MYKSVYAAGPTAELLFHMFLLSLLAQHHYGATPYCFTFSLLSQMAQLF